MANKEAIESLLEIRQAMIKSIDYKHRPSWVDDIIRMIGDKVNNLSSVQVISIPNNATNGDVIKLLFPTAKTWADEDEYCMKIDIPDDFTIECFDLGWWNKKYNGGIGSRI